MRLIGADGIKFEEDCTFSGKGLNEFIRSIPTAYDVDKVVEQLEEASYYTEDGVHTVIGCGRAKGIVKAGGMSDNS